MFSALLATTAAAAGFPAHPAIVTPFTCNASRRAFFMSLPQIPLDLALLAGRAVFLVFCFVLAAVAFTRWRRAAEAASELAAEQNATLIQRLAALEEQLAASREQLSGACERIGALGAKLEEREERRTPAAVTPAAAPSYQIAIRLAKSGAPREELMASCGLSRQEAELVQRLHAPRAPKLAAAS
jgi:hypothetical protein